VTSRLLAISCLFLLSAACSGSDDGTPTADAGRDGGPARDAAPVDAATSVDGAVDVDAGELVDAGESLDAIESIDASEAADSGADSAAPTDDDAGPLLEIDGCVPPTIGCPTHWLYCESSCTCVPERCVDCCP